MEMLLLEPPMLEKDLTLMQALKQRRSVKAFSKKSLSLSTLSELLWAATGVNREDGRRTVPAARNIHAVDIYVMLPEGVYLYEPIKHKLVPVVTGDFRIAAGRQEFVATAPVNLVYVADLEHFKDFQGPDGKAVPEIEIHTWVTIEAGSQAQNVSLYCASEELGSTVRASFDANRLGEVLQLRPAQRILLAQTIGYPQ